MCTTNGNRCKDPEPTIWHKLGTCGRGQGRTVERKRLQDTTENFPQSQLKRTHRGSMRLNQHSGSLYGSDLGPLHICYNGIPCFSCGIPRSGSGGISDFCLLLVPLSSYWFASSNLNMKECA